MFASLLIANRGEIAVRIIRTAKRLGIKTIAVYSYADRNALFVKAADESYALEGSTVEETYLSIEQIINVAKTSGAQAIHPGYGFLSENAEFAEAVHDSGIVFVGPTSNTIALMASKSAAKHTMSEAGVPVTPGYNAAKQDYATIEQEAEKIGYPVIIKAVAGGGGKGMRIVKRKEDLKESLAQVKREAKASFKDDKVILERYVLSARHIEVQVFADTHGNAVHLFERECSIQRRHQKILEEAPAPGILPKLREELGQCALDAVRAINYVGAGTIEFLLDEQNRFYFMEMNTRLQVEHPVTEYITGQDLVEWQLRVASGEPLPCHQDALEIKGHAIEVRVYAEDPDNQFLPAIGTIEYLRQPEQSELVRIDTGIQQGDTISTLYDPMISKLICWDETRQGCLRRMHQALLGYHIVGVKTNITFLATLVASNALVNGHVNTAFIENYRDELLALPQPVTVEVLFIAACAALLQQRQQAEAVSTSPWYVADSWQMNLPSTQDVHLFAQDTQHTIQVLKQSNLDFVLSYKGVRALVSGQFLDETTFQVDIDGRIHRASVVLAHDFIHIACHSLHYSLQILPQVCDFEKTEEHSGNLTAPMPGTIVDIKVKSGNLVAKGEPLLVMEAMKMEHTISAPYEGKIVELLYKVGDMVQEGQNLLILEGQEG